MTIIQSCQKDIDVHEEINSDTDFKSLKGSTAFNYSGLTHNGHYFCVSSKYRLNQIINDLDSRIANVSQSQQSAKNAIPDGQDESDYILNQFTQSYNHDSKFEQYSNDVAHEMSRINSSAKAPGIPNNPADALNNVKDLGLDDSELALLSDDGYICIAGKLYYYSTDGLIIKLKYRTPYMIDYMKSNGLKAALNFYRGYMEVVGKPSRLGLSSFDRECTPEFSATPTAIKDDLKFSFTWSQMAVANLYPNATLSWNFGDGSPTKIQKAGDSDFGEIAHEYAVSGTYVVMLTLYAPVVNDPYEEACNVSLTEHITVQKTGTFDWEDVKDIVCVVAPTLSLAQRDAAVRYTPVPGEEGEYTLSPSFLVDISETAINLINNGQSPIRNVSWTFNGDDIGNGLSVQVSVPCAGSFNGEMTYTCDGNERTIVFTITIEDQDLIRDFKTDWIDRDLTSGKKASFKLKTKSKNPESVFGGNNKLVVKGKHFKQKNNGNWKKEKADFDIDLGGSIVQSTSSGCLNGATIGVNENFTVDNKKKFKKTYKSDYENWNALSVDVSTNTPRSWYIEGSVNGTAFARINAND